MSKKKKTYLALERVRKFIDEQSEETRIEYLNLVDRLEQDGYLTPPKNYRQAIFLVL